MTFPQIHSAPGRCGLYNWQNWRTGLPRTPSPESAAMPLDASRVTPTQIGNYDILGKIAEGGMGTVYKGRRRSDGLIVAIKIIPATTAKNQTLLDRFKREFQAAAELDHPNIVKAIDYNGAGPAPFLVMEYVD